MAYKLLRLMRLMELPGKSWEGWHFSRGMLVTPEGRTISGKDGSWWSLLVRQSRMFTELAAKNQAKQRQVAAPLQREAKRGAAVKPPNLLLEHFRTVHAEHCLTDGAIMGSWPITSESRPPLTLKPVAAVSVSVSALTPSSALPLMPTLDSPLQALRVLPAPFLPSRNLPLPMSIRYQLNSQVFPQSSPSSNAGTLQPHSDRPKSTKTVQGGRP